MLGFTAEKVFLCEHFQALAYFCRVEPGRRLLWCNGPRVQRIDEDLDLVAKRRILLQAPNRVFQLVPVPISVFAMSLDPFSFSIIEGRVELVGAFGGAKIGIRAIHPRVDKINSRIA